MQSQNNSSIKVWVVDAFTKKQFSGNPAAVIIISEFPSDERCQKIAAEMNLSETAFVKPLGDNHFHIRWFTPTVEVSLCGHATLAAAYILFKEKSIFEDEINFASLSGKLRVEKVDSEIMLDFPLQKVSHSFSSPLLSKLFGEIPVINAVIAFDDVIVELNTEDAVLNFEPDISLINQLDCRGLIITAQAQDPYDFVSRFFAPRVGVLEDPVTGSAHCKLADYWQKKLNKTKFFAYQASKRGGDMHVHVNNDRVYLTGSCVPMLEGRLFV